MTRGRHPDAMIPFAAFVSEVSAADLLEQVRWREGLRCPRCQSETVIRYGSYGAFQRYLCKDCDRTFNDKTGMIFACAKIALTEWFFAIYAFLRFNVSIRQLEAETRCLLRNYGNIGNLALWSTETSVNEQTAHRDGD